MYARDNSGLIGLADFERIAKKVEEFRGGKSDSSKIKDLSSKFSYFWIRLKDEIDKNRDNKVSLDEWLKYYETILNDPQRSIPG
ncbi:MAG: hypothetical protein RMY28_029480 [Nostoc sp. ChiSLP01]|nr:hypothetical protein [Nostoc sp. CmiSLP01]MDZ8282936.1 hypothetical protein [Nostoc sp. ChiSLP01]